MLGAAQRLGVSQAMLSRRIASLEAAVGARLLDRTTKGCTLTAQGRTLFDAAERAEFEMLQAASKLNTSPASVSGTVRIAAPDGFGSAFLASRLKDLHALYPHLHIQLVPLARGFSLSQREADLAVMVGRPDKGRLRTKRLTDYSLSLFGSREFLKRFGVPKTLEDLRSLTRVGYVEDLIYTPDLQYAGEFLRDWRSDIEVSTATGQLEVVRSGGGVGILHDFMAAQHRELVRILPLSSVRRSYWIVWHENMRSVRRVAVVADFIEAIVRDNKGQFLPDG